MYVQRKKQVKELLKMKYSNQSLEIGECGTWERGAQHSGRGQAASVRAGEGYRSKVVFAGNFSEQMWYQSIDSGSLNSKTGK